MTSNKITIVDAIMGSGKTSWAIQEMKQNPGPWFFITPYLDEVNRIIEACPKQAFVQPEQTSGHTKSDHLFRLMAEGRNIASTHELFKRINRDTIEMIQLMGYSLIIDEVLEVINPLPVPAPETKAMIDKNALALGESKADGKVFQIVPGPEQDLAGFFVGDDKLPVWYIRQLAEMDRLVWVHGAVLMWLLPADALRAFREVYNLTYLFRGSYAQAFYDLHGFEYDYKTVNRVSGGYELVDTVEPQSQSLSALPQINIYDGPLNTIGDPHYALSNNWWNQHKKERENIMRAKMYTYFRHKAGNPCPKANDIMWTCFKPNKQGIADGRYVHNWMPYNQRATNLYRDKSAAAFLVNRFMNTYIKSYFEALNMYLSEELFALSELLQWIWRSAIRDGNPVNLFLPSSRMRGLLNAWFNGVPVADIG